MRERGHPAANHNHYQSLALTKEGFVEIPFQSTWCTRCLIPKRGGGGTAATSQIVRRLCRGSKRRPPRASPPPGPRRCPPQAGPGYNISIHVLSIYIYIDNTCIDIKHYISLTHWRHTTGGWHWGSGDGCRSSRDHTGEAGGRP